MRTRIRLANGDDVVLAGSALRSLAVRRTEPLLLDSGIPPIMSSSPDALREAARDYLQGALKPRGPFGDERGFGAAHAGAIGRMLDRLEGDYGEDEVEGLASWLTRHFIDWGAARRWSAWADLFPRLAGMHRRAPVASPHDLSIDTLERVRGAVEARFNEEAEDKVRAHVEEAYAIPLSEAEVQLTVIEAPDNDGNYPSYANVVLPLKVAVRPERAYHIWQELNERLTEDERRAVVEWGHGEADAAGVRWIPQMSHVGSEG